MKKRMSIRLILLITLLWLPLVAPLAPASAQDQAPTEPTPETAFNNQVWLPMVVSAGATDTQTLSALDPDVATVMSSQVATQQTSVIVILKDQTNLKAVTGKNRKEKRKNLVKALRKKADDTQVSLRARLVEWRRQGQVQTFTPLWVLNGIALTATNAVINALASAPEVDRILLDVTLQGPVGQSTTTPPPEQNLNVINAPALWDLGFSGQGIVVANMDTGVDYTHPDLAPRWRGGSNSWFDPYGQYATPTDRNGHGTWTMGIIVGGSNGGTAIGVAPQAQWIAVKIFNDSNTATSSAIHLGFQWLLDPDGNPATADAPDVVNNSWVFSTPGCNLTFQPDLQVLLAAEILPLFAAGNYGPSSPTDVSPANNPEAFAVGGINNNNVVYAYSSRGPTSCGRSAATTYPDLAAPGVNVTTSDLFGLYTANSGTSFAAPHAAGALALLLSAFPNLTATQQKAALINSAHDLGVAGPDNVFGQGRLDVLGAYQWLVANAGNQPPTVYAGSDQAITLPAEALLVGTAGDDGLPASATLVTTWSVVSGPGTVTFGDIHALQTNANFSAAGSYTLRLTADDGQLSVSDDLSVTVNQTPPTNQPPTANAGADQTITLPSAASLNGVTTDDGLPTPPTLMTTWSFVSGPGVVTFANSQALQTTATFAAAGTYTLRLTANDGQLTASDDVVIIVNPQPNQPPSANAGTDQTITLPSAASLNGVATDDGLPTPATLVTTWSVVSGPGAVTFANPQALQTTATFGAAGTYTLRLTANDGQLTASDEIVIIVNPQPVSANVLYVSTSANGNVGGVTYQDEDILAYNPSSNRWSLVFDGSDVGLGSGDIDAFDILADGTFLLSLDNSLTLNGLAVKDADILRFTPTSLGATTAGSFAFYLRGADVGLTTTDEDIDAIDLMPDGRLLFSTLGNVSMPGVSGADEDLIALNMSTRVATLYFDGSNVGLTASSEDVWGVWVDNTGKLHLSTQGAFAVTGVSGTGADVFTCTLLTTGLNTTSCTYSSYWKGSDYGFGAAIIDGIAVAGALPLFTPAAQGRAAVIDDARQSNTDDDPLNGDVYTGEPELAAKEESVQTTFLPLMKR